MKSLLITIISVARLPVAPLEEVERGVGKLVNIVVTQQHLGSCS